jgi:hypothetical protein
LRLRKFDSSYARRKTVFGLGAGQRKILTGVILGSAWQITGGANTALVRPEKPSSAHR